MRHVEKALEKMTPKLPDGHLPNCDDAHNFIALENTREEKGVAPIVKFTIQSDPIGEVGVNGLQVTDMLEYVKQLFISLDESFPCIENAKTIASIKQALYWQSEGHSNRV